MVRPVGLEPTRDAIPAVFETAASTSSATAAFGLIWRLYRDSNPTFRCDRPVPFPLDDRGLVLMFGLGRNMQVSDVEIACLVSVRGW